MERVRITVAVADPSFNQDLQEIELFIHRLNNSFIDLNFYLAVTTWVISNHPNLSLPANADFTIFLITDPTAPEFTAAYREAHRQTLIRLPGVPLFATFLKAPPQGAELPVADPPAVQDLPSLLYTSYAHIDTLKLAILLELRHLNLKGLDIRLDGGSIWQGGTPLLTLQNVEAIQGYAALQQLQTQRSSLEERYYASKAQYLENPEDTTAYQTFYTVSKERAQATQEVRDLEAKLYHIMEGMYEQTNLGKLTRRQAEAYRFIQRGMLQEAKAVLDFAAIVNDTRQDEARLTQATERAQAHIAEQMQLKYINTALRDWNGVEECLREAQRLEERYNLPRQATLDHIDFLYSQKRYSEAITLAEALEQTFSSAGRQVNLLHQGRLFSLLGELYRLSSQSTKAEEKYRLAIAQAKHFPLSDDNRHVYQGTLVESQMHLGQLYWQMGRLPEAEELYLAAQETLAEMEARSPGAQSNPLSQVHNYLGIIYDLTARAEASEAMHLANIQMLSKLVAINPDGYEPLLGNSYNNLGLLYWHNQRYREAEEALRTALEIRLKLVDYNPSAYERHLAGNYNNLFLVNRRLGLHDTAIAMIQTAIKLASKLAAREPDAFEPLLASYLNNLGDLLTDTLTED